MKKNLIEVVGIVAILFLSFSYITTTMADNSKPLTQSDLQYPLSPEIAKSIERTVDDFLYNKIFDLEWKKLFHYFTNFEALDGFAVTASAGSSVVIPSSGDRVNFTADATSGHLAELTKGYLNFGLATFSQKSNMRTSFSYSATPAVQTTYIVTGSISATGTSFYGFKIVNAVLYGVSSNNGTNNETTVQLMTGLTSDIYNVEARYTPNVGISFYAQDGSSAIINYNTPKGMISTKLPNPAQTTNTVVMDIKLTTNEAVQKILTVSFFEVLQYRNILR